MEGVIEINLPRQRTLLLQQVVYGCLGKDHHRMQHLLQTTYICFYQYMLVAQQLHLFSSGMYYVQGTPKLRKYQQEYRTTQK
jgi:hypothetical protein